MIHLRQKNRKKKRKKGSDLKSDPFFLIRGDRFQICPLNLEVVSRFVVLSNIETHCLGFLIDP